MNFSQQLNVVHTKYAFYDLNLNNKAIAEGVEKELKTVQAQNVLIIGFVGIANELMKKGFNMTILALNNEMRDYVKSILPSANLIYGKIKNRSYNDRFDAIICLGDTFSQFTKDEEVFSVMSSFYEMLKYGGIVLFENVAASKILESNERAITKVELDGLKIKRTSKLAQQTTYPTTAIWNVTYELMQNGKRSIYEECLKIRGFTGKEIDKFLKSTNFQLVKFLKSKSGNNFLTIARK